MVNLKFQGLESLDLKALRPNLGLKEGGPFHSALLDLTLDAIRAAYAAKGYPQAQVSARQDWNADRTLVDITVEARDRAHSEEILHVLAEGGYQPVHITTGDAID